MSLVRSLAVAIALGGLVATALPASADPGKITRYVFPDGTVVYSDKPVPGAAAVGEIVVPPAPAPPPVAASPRPDDERTDAPPPAPDDEPPVIAEAHDGKCYLRVTSGCANVRPTSRLHQAAATRDRSLPRPLPGAD